MMVQSTPSRLFQSFKPLSRFKIHHPLPLNARESQQLLNLLTASFRQQLDREHGQLPFQKELTVPKVIVGSSKRHKQSSESLSLKNGGTNDVDNHINSLLSNPLLSVPNRPLVNNSETLRDPLDVFDDACAKGLMNVELAENCLRVKKGLIVQSSSLTFHGDAKESGPAAAKVLTWLAVNGLIKADTFKKI